MTGKARNLNLTGKAGNLNTTGKAGTLNPTLRTTRGGGLLLRMLAVFVVSIVVFLIAGELVLRYTNRELTTTSDARSFFNRRWMSREVQLNSWGFRERELTFDKAPGVYRIAVIGDSVTFGYGMPDRERFTNHLHERLASRGREVLNFGRPGTDTADHIADLRNIVLRAHPDFVLMQWYVNDFEGHVVRDRLPLATPGPLVRLHARLVGWSAFHSLLTLNMQGRFSGIAEYLDYMRAFVGDPGSARSQAAIAQIREFIRLCRSDSVGVGIVLFPHLAVDPADPYPLDYLHRRVLDVCSEQRLACVDLRSTFAEHRNYKELWVTRLDYHPNALANRMAASRLMEVYGPTWDR